VIAWLAAQPWSTGAVGMYGVSYGGFNSIQVAMDRPPALKAIIPIFATDDRYTDDVHFYGGVKKQLDFIDYPLYMVCMNALPPVPEIAGPNWRKLWLERLEGLEPWLPRWIEEQNDGAYWRHGSLRPHYERIVCPTMIVAGWADGYRNASFRMFERLDVAKRLLFGPWAHASTETSLPGPRIDLVPELLRWFDHHLKGEDNGIDKEPPIVVFARRSTRPATDLDSYKGEWRHEPVWPPERLEERRLELPGADERRLEVRGDVGVTAWISCAGHGPFGQPDDQRPDEAFSLLYDWGPFDEELEILGYPRLEVGIAASSPVAFLSAKLSDVFEDGASALVARGFLNLTHRDSHQKPEALEPGRTYDVTLELDATSWTWEPGHVLRLAIAGTDWPNAWPPPENATLKVERARSALVLPVVPGPAPATEPVKLHPPTTSTDSEPVTSPLTWRIERDVPGRVTRAVIDHGASGRLENGTHFTERYGGEVGVSLADLGNAWAAGKNSFELSWGAIQVGAEARGELRSDRDFYHLSLELDVSEAGRPLWSKHWQRRYPRLLQ
jgi:predicted acyl esterase